MDALLSVPALGYLLLPFWSSYSTSVNFLLFYLMWITLILSQPPLKVEVVGTLAVRAVFSGIPSTLFLLFDTLLPSLAVGIKRQGASSLPTRTGGVPETRKEDGRPQWYQVIALSLFNICLGVAVQAGVEILFTDVFQIRSALKVTTTLPMPWSVAKEIIRALLLREVLQYFIHRYLHSPYAPAYIRKLHSSYYHSVTAPFSFAAHYDHPIPYFLWRFLPLYLPAIAFRTHLVTYLLLLALVSLEESLTLSGYTTIPGIMLGGFARRQDLHNESRGRGNFAPWGLMDWLMGTSIGADVVDDMKDEAEKHQLAERSGKAWDNAKEGGKTGVRAWRSRRKSSKKAPVITRVQDSVPFLTLRQASHLGAAGYHGSGSQPCMLSPAHGRIRQMQQSNDKPAIYGPKMLTEELKNFLADSPPSTVRLEIKKHFNALSDQQKRYAHYISRAAFTGTRITLQQVSPESESIYDFIVELHKACNGDWKALQMQAGVSDTEIKYLLEYSAQFLGNCGNYKGFGDAKFVPRADEKAFAALALVSPQAEMHYKATKGAIFSSDPAGIMHLGFLDDGHMTTYYPNSPSITKKDIEAIKDFLEKKKLMPENTRLRKTSEGNFELLIASAVTKIPNEGGDIGSETVFKLEDSHLQGRTLSLIYGDYSKLMSLIAQFHEKAAENSENENQNAMQLEYAKSFSSGSMEAFKNSQRYWIRDKGPMVESNIGFVETYRDPAGVRGEWEGWAATINLERTAAFSALVSGAEALIPLLPWSRDFEKDKFLSPDFTSLEVLSFAGSGIPAGINIPNFDDIRQSEGFKNVSLGNVLSAKAPDEKIPFISTDDLPVYSKYRDIGFEIQVGIHELLGHGTGKLLQEISPGVYNFNKDKPPVSPITKNPITTWYKPGQTWGSVFGSIAASYEECRAECVAMDLSCEFSILKLFGVGDGEVDMNGEAGDVLYAIYLSMARAGVASLETWDPKSRKWGQAHSQARYSILRCFLDAGDDFCKLKYNAADLSDLTIVLDRSKILTTGRKAVESYLQKLHVYKCTADLDAGSKLYTKMTTVDPDFWGMKVRNEALRNKQPRKVFVQANTFLNEATGEVELKEYAASVEGMIQSYVERNV